jgi:hypothetical protein
MRQVNCIEVLSGDCTGSDSLERQMNALFMVPFGLTEKQFVSWYKKCLDRASHHFINELRQLFHQPVPTTVTNVNIEIFLSEDDESKPDARIYYNGKNSKVDDKDPAIFPGYGIHLSLGLEQMEDFDRRYFQDDIFDGRNLIADTVKAWLAECWWKAGGWAYPVPVHLQVHDDFGDGFTIKLSEKD